MFLLRLLVISVPALFFDWLLYQFSFIFHIRILKNLFPYFFEGLSAPFSFIFIPGPLVLPIQFPLFSSIDLPSNSVSVSLFPVVILPVQFQLSFSNIFYYKVSFIFILRLLVLRIHFHLSFLTLCSTKSVLSVFFHWLSYQLTLNLFIDWHSNNSVLSFFFTWYMTQKREEIWYLIFALHLY